MVLWLYKTSLVFIFLFMQPQTTQKQFSLSTSKKAFHVLLTLVLLGGIVFLFVWLQKDRPLSQRQIEKAFERMGEVPVETTMTQEEVEATFEKLEAVPVENTLTEEEKASAFQKMQEVQ